MQDVKKKLQNTVDKTIELIYNDNKFKGEFYECISIHVQLDKEVYRR